jgi:hypothetical protein
LSYYFASSGGSLYFSESWAQARALPELSFQQLALRIVGCEAKCVSYSAVYLILGLEGLIKSAEIVCPKLVQDGMFLVVLDIVGGKLMETNVFSLVSLNKDISSKK